MIILPNTENVSGGLRHETQSVDIIIIYRNGLMFWEVGLFTSLNTLRLQTKQPYLTY